MGRETNRLLLSFQAASGDALDELFLGEEEQDDHGGDDHSGCGHLEVDRGTAGLGAERLKSDGEGPGFLLLEVEEGGEEVVPGAHKAEQGDDGKCGLGQGEDDLTVDAPFTAAVDFGGFGEFHRDTAIELAEEEDVECASEPSGNPEGTKCADPAEVFEETEEGHHENREGNHHRGKGDGEGEISAGPFETGKGVGDDGVTDDSTGHCEDTYNQAVSSVDEHRGDSTELIFAVFPRFFVVAAHEGIRDPDRRKDGRLFDGFETGRDHPDKGNQENDGQEAEDEMNRADAEQVLLGEGAFGHGQFDS